MQLSNNHAAGILTNTQPRQHERPREWRAVPPPALLSEEMQTAWSDYLATLQHQSATERERAALFSSDADDTALRLDQEAAATVKPGEPVTTANLDQLTQDRRRIIVAMGGAGIACDNALMRAAQVRNDGPTALNPAAAETADKARAAALALLDKLMPHLETIAQHAAAVRWAAGEPFAPSRDLIQTAESIRGDLIL